MREPIDGSVDEVRRLVAAGDLGAAAARLADVPDDELRAVVSELYDEDLGELLQRTSPTVAADVLEHLDADDAADLLEDLPAEISADILDQLVTDHAVAVLEELPPELAARAAAAMELADARALLQTYAEGTAGRLMTPNPFAVSDALSVAQALDALREAGHERLGSVAYLYVVNADRRLVGLAGLHETIMADPATPIADVMRPFPISIHVDTAEEEAVRLFRHTRLVGLPVIDDDARLVGLIRADRLVQQADEEAEEDLLGVFGGSDARETESVTETMRNRLPWLGANLFFVSVGAAVVAVFQPTIDAVVALAVFLPVVAGMGGNAGSQTVAVLVRRLALGPVRASAGRRALRRELTAGLASGILFGAAAGVLGGLWAGSVVLGLIVGGALLGALVGAAAAGTLIPLGLKAIGQDPAIGSTVLLTTVTDVIGFSLLLGVATLLLHLLV